MQFKELVTPDQDLDYYLVVVVADAELVETEGPDVFYYDGDLVAGRELFFGEEGTEHFF